MVRLPPQEFYSVIDKHLREASKKWGKAHDSHLHTDQSTNGYSIGGGGRGFSWTECRRTTTGVESAAAAGRTAIIIGIILSLFVRWLFSWLYHWMPYPRSGYLCCYSLAADGGERVFVWRINSTETLNPQHKLFSSFNSPHSLVGGRSSMPVIRPTDHHCCWLFIFTNTPTPLKRLWVEKKFVQRPILLFFRGPRDGFLSFAWMVVG